MNCNIHFHQFDTRDELAEVLSATIAQNLQNAINLKGTASLIVSGGSTPKTLFEKLRKKKIEWEKVTVGLCDERWVAPAHDDSNEKFVKTWLLQDEASRAAFSGMHMDLMDAEEAEQTCSENIQTYLWPFDVLILGMGDDAHTASLFPDNPKLDKGFDLDNQALCVAIEPQSAPHMRMSLTRKAILSADHLYLHFEGKNKLAVFKEAENGENSYKMPIRSILKQDKKNVEVYYA